jgi:hypothetical protein
VIIGAGEAKRVLFRGIGPELKAHAVPGALDDTTLELHDVNSVLLGSNDNWIDAGEIAATGIAPVDNRESAILLTLGPGRYTSIVRGANGSTGIGLAEAYKWNN